MADRPAELADGQPAGPGLGYQGPDQGYALRLVRQFDGQLVLTNGEHASDAEAGCVAVALRRASMFGRAPVIHDLTVAFTIWGFLSGADPELVNEDVLRLGPAAAATVAPNWRANIDVAAASAPAHH